MSIPTLIVIYVALLLGALCGWGFIPKCAAAASARRTRKTGFFAAQNCGYVYTDDADVDRSRCSQCGKLNEPIVF